MRNKQDLYANKPQVLAGLVYAPTLCVNGGRGIGKTHGLIAPRAYRHAKEMPRSLGAFVGRSYDSIVNSIIPACIKSWESMGLIEGVHFLVGEDPAKKGFRWGKPVRAPKEFKNVVSWVNGSSQMFNSLDKNAFNNGREFDYADYDEYRFLPREGIAEFNKAIRGNDELFGGLSCHGARTYCGDMPKYAEERWIFDIAKQHDDEAIEHIIRVEEQFQIYRLKAIAAGESGDTVQEKYYYQKASGAAKILNKLRFNVVQYVTASTLDNIDVLGANTILNMIKTEQPLEVVRGIINLDTSRSSSLFYSSFNDKKHTYTASNVSYIENLDLNFRNDKKDCRWDSDHMPSSPLHIAVDWGVTINCMEVAQRYNNANKVLKSFDVLRPKKISHLVDEFCEYYRFHEHKVVYHYYDHTGNNESPISDITYKQELYTLLKKKGWTVRQVYIGQAKPHSVRYKFYENLFNDYYDGLLPKLLINADNCGNLIASIENAGATEDKYGRVAKDKKPEQKKDLDQTKTTHHSEALDQLVTGMMIEKVPGHNNSFVSARTM